MEKKWVINRVPRFVGKFRKKNFILKLYYFLNFLCQVQGDAGNSEILQLIEFLENFKKLEKFSQFSEIVVF